MTEQETEKYRQRIEAARRALLETVEAAAPCGQKGAAEIGRLLNDLLSDLQDCEPDPEDQAALDDMLDTIEAGIRTITDRMN